MKKILALMVIGAFSMVSFAATTSDDQGKGEGKKERKKGEGKKKKSDEAPK